MAAQQTDRAPSESNVQKTLALKTLSASGHIHEGQRPVLELVKSITCPIGFIHLECNIFVDNVTRIGFYTFRSWKLRRWQH